MIRYEIEKQENGIVNATITIRRDGCTQTQHLQVDSSTEAEDRVVRAIRLFITKQVVHESLTDLGFAPPTYQGRGHRD